MLEMSRKVGYESGREDLSDVPKIKKNVIRNSELEENDTTEEKGVYREG